MIIRRAFADLNDRQVHFRHGGAGEIPLVMLHASPGSSKQLEPLIAELAATRRVIAPDTPGNGDSTKLPLEAPQIQDYAAATLEFLDAHDLKQIDLYGSHTGASIATELAILAPDRIRKVILDGVGLFSAEERDEYLANYSPAITPDLNGAHLNWAFMFCRDQYQFWPWYKRTRETSRAAGLPTPTELHNWVLEVLKSIETYHLGYRAAFAYPKAERLPLVTRPILAIVDENDPLLSNTKLIVGMAPDVTFTVTSRARDATSHPRTADAISAFLDR
jgi:pimeloyl-ACP methyl ester carboxylesterase